MSEIKLFPKAYKSKLYEETCDGENKFTAKIHVQNGHWWPMKEKTD